MAARRRTRSANGQSSIVLPDPLSHAVVYVHGIGSQAPEPETRRAWDTALFGEPRADTDMAYWADLRHSAPAVARTRGAARRTRGQARTGPERERFVEALRAQMERRSRANARAGAIRSKVFRWLPGVGDALFGWLTKGFIEDTAAYFFDRAMGDAMRARVSTALGRHAGRPLIVIAHSQGSIIAYDVLTQLGGRSPAGGALDVALFVTIGSPLGIDEIQRKLAARPTRGTWPVPPGVRAWANYADPFDPVALDKGLTGEFNGRVTVHDTLVRNPILLNPHSAVGYLSVRALRTTVYSVLGRNELRFGSRVRKDVLANMLQTLALRELDVPEQPPERHSVLIELRDPAAFGAAAARGLKPEVRLRSLDDHRAEVERYLKKAVADRDKASIDPLHRYVAARLTSAEIQALDAECVTSVYCVWNNARKRALIRRSAAVVQVPAARVAYRADGSDVTWAVLDTGVRSAHPHFRQHANIEKVWDCTQAGPPRDLLAGRGGSQDRDGHGTHVCGIIAGQQGTKGKAEFVGLAPRAKLHVYKVLDDAGCQPRRVPGRRLGQRRPAAHLRHFLFLFTRAHGRRTSQARPGGARRGDLVVQLRIRTESRHALHRAERHQHGRAARLRVAGRVPLRAPRIPGPSGRREAHRAGELHRPRPRAAAAGSRHAEPGQDAHQHVSGRQRR